MEFGGEATLLRIFLGESDRVRGHPLGEFIVNAAKQQGLAGATLWRGLLSYGATSFIHTFKILELSHKLPIIVEIVDTEDKINVFLPILDDLFEEARCGGLVTMEKVKVIKYIRGNKGSPDH